MTSAYLSSYGSICFTFLIMEKDVSVVDNHSSFNVFQTHGR